MKTCLLLVGLFGLLYPVASASAEELQARVCTDVQTSDASLAPFASYLNREFRALPDVVVVLDRCDYRVRLLLLEGTRQLVVSMFLERSMGDLLPDSFRPKGVKNPDKLVHYIKSTYVCIEEHKVFTFPAPTDLEQVAKRLAATVDTSVLELVRQAIQMMRDGEKVRTASEVNR